MNIKEMAGNLQAQDLRFGIVISRYNDLFTQQLLRGALDCFQRHGAHENSVTVAWVPGALEIPLAVQKLAQTKKFDALVALGVVIQGATPHAGIINGQVARALTQIGLKENLPVIDGVVAADNLEQAIERSGSKAGNRGWSAALSAIEMASLLKNITA
ncbi:MAG: 6,7-dimethyl-8-ribityllumazine synthase [Verrucomicrobia bacterium]|nr:6,7-dimethyl-8-ribityllumazine synthase [Verrucomicrobiota bacterium]MCG2681728.1 6,7-dimethyl-8-ribityllumazine synthase [Kiritimatiellia bacterium]MBU4247664.1 6,7-dimethyl-8-ribityllumazine synthase [Verrucomicrobiota bacterium]MBU4290485.1 6,7-dimethyl-8-ribityllumazine synthase [Verrucomicrobiota bacterium]MBU4428195.1 6,7-dimethyl-8-ribityllumazine synthase [Verrucomicrobiota bacterium]